MSRHRRSRRPGRTARWRLQGRVRCAGHV